MNLDFKTRLIGQIQQLAPPQPAAAAAAVCSNKEPLGARISFPPRLLSPKPDRLGGKLSGVARDADQREAVAGSAGEVSARFRHGKNMIWHAPAFLQPTEMTGSPPERAH